MGRNSRNPDFPVIISCHEEKEQHDLRFDDEEPEKGTTRCDLTKQKYCLFDISSDPCEKNNIAESYPPVVEFLLKGVESYNSKFTAVPTASRPNDSRSHPVFHSGYWYPWMDEELL